MKKRLIAIAIACVIAAPLTAQAAASPTDTYFETPTHQVSVAKAGNGMDGVGMVASTSGIKVMPVAVGTGAGLFDSEPTTVVASGGDCGSCHSIKGDVPSGVHGGGTIGISKTS